MPYKSWRFYFFQVPDILGGWLLVLFQRIEDVSGVVSVIFWLFPYGYKMAIAAPAPAKCQIAGSEEERVIPVSGAETCQGRGVKEVLCPGAVRGILSA